MTNTCQLVEVLDRLDSPRVLVLGDLILDRYTCGDTERVSQEAPVIVLRAEQSDARLGGAANVCHMLRGLGAEVICAGVVGDDESGHCVREMLRGASIDDALILRDASRPTTVKERFVGRAGTGHPTQILRVDREVRTPLCGPLQEELVERIVAEVSRCDVVLISDYGKGVCTKRVVKKTIEVARGASVPVIVDPARGADFAVYHGATALKPNRLETELATGVRIETADDALSAGRRLCHDLQLDLAIVTLDREGMALVRREESGELFPIDARSVFDITGAGDMVLAMLGVCFGCGTSPEDAVQLGNAAAGLEVQRAGVAVVTKPEIRGHLISASQPGATKILGREQAGRLAEEERHRGKKIAFTNGCFDLLHVGHATYLAEAAAMADVLIVGVNSDQSVRRLKGPARPVIGESDRAAMLAALGCVDYVVVYDEDTPHALLHAIRPDVLVKGGTYTPEQVVGHEVVRALGGQVRVTGVVEGISTTGIVESVSQRAENPAKSAA